MNTVEREGERVLKGGDDKRVREGPACLSY
jgi:hypothetical protein